MSLHNEQPPIQRPELVEPPTNEINGQPVIYEQNTEPGCNWPGGNFQARVEGSAPSFGNSYAEAYRSLEQRLSGIDQVPPARSPRRPPVAAQPETDDDAQTARSEQQPAFSGTQGVLTAEDLEQQPVDDALEAPVVEAPVAEAPVAEAPVAEAPVAEAPVADAPVADAPVAEAPVVEAPVAVTETPAAENQTATFIA